MAFNGTAHFPKQQLVEFLESTGMRFGPELNASTGFDETIYMLRVPTDNPVAMPTAFQILEDWARGVSFDPEEIDRERGVVVEERRLGQGAGARMRDKQFPIVFAGSRYAERLPIGLKDTLEKFPHDALTRFYRTWYRPDLMAVIAVGDFARADVEALVKKHFGQIPRTSGPARPMLDVPDHAGTRFGIATDKRSHFSVLGNGIAIDGAHVVELEHSRPWGASQTRAQLAVPPWELSVRVHDLFFDLDPLNSTGLGTFIPQIMRLSGAGFPLQASTRGDLVQKHAQPRLLEAARACLHKILTRCELVPSNSSGSVVD